MSNSRPSSPAAAARQRADIDRRLDAGFFKALGDPTRLNLVACLAKCGRAASVGEVAECCHVDLSVVSRHLALLARAGILEAKKDGRTVRYRMRYRELSALLRALADAIDQCCPPAAANGSCCDETCT